MKLESKIGKIAYSSEIVYNFLTNYDNFKKFIPTDKIQDWETGDDWCKFKVSPIGATGIKTVEKEPFSLIKLANLDEGQYNFFFWVQLKQVDVADTRIKLTIDVNLNPMLQMMAKKPLQDFLDKLVDQMATVPFDKL